MVNLYANHSQEMIFEARKSYIIFKRRNRKMDQWASYLAKTRTPIKILKQNEQVKKKEGFHVYMGIKASTRKFLKMKTNFQMIQNGELFKSLYFVS